jgi:hypothetical protein
MEHPDAADLWRKDFIATLRLIGSAAARLPYGVPEPVLGGDAAIELYSGGLWPTRKLELLAADARRLQAELIGIGLPPRRRLSLRRAQLVASHVRSRHQHHRPAGA